MQHRVSLFLQLLMVIALAAGFLPSQAALAQSSDAQDIVDTAVGAGQFTTLVAAVQAAGLVDALKGDGPYTVFAPTDEAFAKLPAGTVEALLADPEGQLKQILLYHVLPNQVMAADVSDGLEAATLQGDKVKFSIQDGKAMINDANIVATDIVASNGVIHVIDSVILPPAAEAAPVAAAEATVPMTTTAGAAVPAETMAAPLDIVDTAVGAGQFTTLVAAVQAAGLVDALKGDGPFTVFAPTDEAFAKLPAGTVDALLADPEGQLKQILLYHVLSGQVMAADVSDGLEAATLQGDKVKFSVQGGKPMINDANIVATDIVASNGVIHVIDSVILPPAPEAAAAAPAPAADASGAAMSESAPDTMPVTGSESTTALPIVVAGLLVLALGGLAFVSRRRMA